MSMETHIYEALVSEKAKVLEQTTGHPVSHGQVGSCPTCGHVGFYDLKGLGVSASSIYFSTPDEKWCCMSCELQLSGC